MASSEWEHKVVELIAGGIGFFGMLALFFSYNIFSSTDSDATYEDKVLILGGARMYALWGIGLILTAIAVILSGIYEKLREKAD
jgi:hypothetical protein